MILDIAACLLIWGAIEIQKRLKTKNTGSSLDNFEWALVQGVLIGAAFIILKMNPHPC